jgi:multiple sugar transport system substrate-binding protein
MVPNPSLSIPASEYAEKDRYMNQMVTMEWPDKPDGSPIEYVTSIKTAVIFKDAQNKEAAKEFMRFFLKPENLGPQLEGALARWFPVDKRLIDTPYWKATDDPHRVVEVAQYTQRPQTVWPHYLNYKLIDINAENAYGKAVGRVVLEDWSAEDAVEELIERIKQVAGS